MSSRCSNAYLKLFALGSVSSLTLMAGAAMAQDQSAAEVGDVVVTGIRGGAPRTAIESPTPIDVFNAEQLSQGAQTGVFESIRYLVPSFNLPTRAGGGSATVIATYRHLRRSILLAFKGIRSINHTMARTRIRTDTSN